MTSHEYAPAILCIGGLDPCGCSGIAADITTVQTLRAHACPLVSVVTVQSTKQAFSQHAIETEILQQQLTALQTVDFACVKIGLIHESHVALIANFLNNLQCPVVMDPVLAASEGVIFHTSSNCLTPLIPNAIITPNQSELAAFGGLDQLRQLNPQAIILSDDAHGISLYHRNDSQAFPYVKREQNYRGTGCTFSAALAVFLAQEHTLSSSVESALRYVQSAIDAAYRADDHALVPQRAVTLPL